ncbi:cytokine receptor common subunit gamma-like [Bombina bombina]|uniref:cytokine receptor common subunit gamma-like n=1 Tax=Bombina bombina TaxID=8345 RepID=UPI00235AA2E1|nr:cytokine receptor common subunit gamma-like [Bombina bombina]
METSEEMGPSVFMIILLLLSQSVHCQEESVLQCIADKNKCITCMWNQQGTPKENYTLYYRILNFESQPALPCRNYLQDGQINIGCWINAPTVNLFSPFVVQLNSTNRDKPIIREYERMQTMVKLDPPYNLTIKATNHSELLLQWQFDHGHFPVLCICFQVEHQNMASKEGKVKEVRSALFSLPSYDPKQIYTFRVRNKLCEICADAKMWSEWSEEITWGKNETLIVFFAETAPFRETLWNVHV